MIGREHVCVSDVVSSHLFDIFRIRNRDEHIFSRNTECFGQKGFEICHMLQNFKQQDRVKRSVLKRKYGIHVCDGKTVPGGLP